MRRMKSSFSKRAVLAFHFLLIAACAREPQPSPAPSSAPASEAAPTAPAADRDDAPIPVNPPAPGTPGGLPDDRTPLSEAPFTATSAQGAANVLQTYYALIGAGRYDEAWRLWTQAGEGSGMSAEAFAASFAPYESYNANIGAPGRIEGAAGSLYVSVPVQIYGRRKSGEPVHMLGSATLRRSNDVPGSTAEQRAWHIYRIDLQPSADEATRPTSQEPASPQPSSPDPSSK
ncbi:MAG TPA: hypothetical protein VFS52_10035 [Steroidobacteraceae bacterium]|nr:hypothetical protein [Steroidobacteraceae bacterium]